jgi:hypothetical protein
MRDSAMIAATQAFVATFAVVWLVGSVPIPGYEAIWPQRGAYEFGRAFATGPPAQQEEVLASVRGMSGVLALLVLYGTTLKVLTDTENREAYVLASSMRAVVLGVVFANAAFLCLLIGPAILASAIAFAVGAGAPGIVLSIPLAAVFALLVTAAGGAVCALSARALFAGAAYGRVYKVAIGGPLALGYFGLFIWFRRASAILSMSPLGWFGDLALLPARGPARLTIAAGALLVSGGTLGITTILLTRLAEHVWLRAERSEPETTGSGTVLHGGFALFERLCSRPTAAVARILWLRVRREPRSLVYTMLPVAITISAGLELARRRPAALPMIVAVYGSIAVGMGPSLNPLGNDGPRLSLTLSTPGGATALLRGYVVATALPGAVAVAASTLLVGVAVSSGPLVLLGITLLGAWLALVAVAASLGIGIAMPERDGLSPTSGSTLRSPRLEATGVLFVVMALVGLPALIGPFWREELAAESGLGAPMVTVLAVTLTILSGTVVALTSYGYAAHRLDGYQIDQ